jgi:hypothetical protein
VKKFLLYNFNILNNSARCFPPCFFDDERGARRSVALQDQSGQGLAASLPDRLAADWQELPLLRRGSDSLQALIGELKKLAEALRVE